MTKLPKGAIKVTDYLKVISVQQLTLARAEDLEAVGLPCSAGTPACRVPTHRDASRKPAKRAVGQVAP